MSVIVHLVLVHVDGIFVVDHAAYYDGSVLLMCHLPFLCIGVLPFADDDLISVGRLSVFECHHVVSVSRALYDIHSLWNQVG